MAEIQPFRGIRYNQEKIKLEEVITEPYDRISPSLREAYYKRNPMNFVRVILGKDEDPEHQERDRYKRAKIYLDEWQEQGILTREEKKALYVYEQEFEVRGEKKRRRGFITRVKLEEFSTKKVLPHEKTFPKHKVDRLNLLRVTNMNTGQIFLLYKDDDRRVTQAIDEALEGAELGAEVQDEDNYRHIIWVIKESAAIQRIQKAMADKVLIIADGHHRYETSLMYQREKLTHSENIKGDEPFNYIMMTLFRLDDPGLIILPTFRLIKGLDKLTEESLLEILSPHFEIQSMDAPDPFDAGILSRIQDQVEQTVHSFAAFIASFQKFFIFRLKSEDLLEREIDEEKSKEWRGLDVTILHSLIIDKLEPLSSSPYSLENNVSYIRNLEQGLQKVNDGEFQMIFLLKPVSLHQIGEVVEKGELMPQKSTDFFPKLKSGLVINPLDE